MRKRNSTVQLSRSPAHRRALLRNLSQELLRHGEIRTTLAKAKALRPFVEPIINIAKMQGEAGARAIAAIIYDHAVVKKLVNEIGPRYSKEQRVGGYTRIIKLGQRTGDAAEEAVIQLVRSPEVAPVEPDKVKNEKK